MGDLMYLVESIDLQGRNISDLRHNADYLNQQRTYSADDCDCYGGDCSDCICMDCSDCED